MRRNYNKIRSRYISTTKNLRVDYENDHISSDVDSVSEVSVYSKTSNLEDKLRRASIDLKNTNKFSEDIRSDLRKNTEELNSMMAKREFIGTNDAQVNKALRDGEESTILKKDQFIDKKEKSTRKFLVQTLGYSNSIVASSGLFAAFKSNVNSLFRKKRTLEEEELALAVKGNSLDLLKMTRNAENQLKNADKLEAMVEKKVPKHKSSNLDDYASLSDQMPSYMDPED